MRGLYMRSTRAGQTTFVCIYYMSHFPATVPYRNIYSCTNIGATVMLHVCISYDKAKKNEEKGRKRAKDIYTCKVGKEEKE